MSVIIRLQNLPWSANALDIRQFFKGLSIPEGGVHIVGGENGDAFIAFSTDEDARQAMMRDREKLNEVQVRLLLSSRAEMQKVIETARQQSMLALQKAGAILAPKIINTPLPTPQPPVITSNSLQNILSNQLGAAPSFLAYQQQAGITLVEKLPEKIIEKPADAPASTSRRDSRESARDRRRSSSRERRRSRSRDRNERNERNDRGVSRRRGGGRERSQSRSREHDWKDGGRGGRNTSRRSSRERMRDRSRERGDRNDRERSRNNYSSSNRNGSKTEKDNFGNRRSAKDNFDSKSSNVFRGGSTESTDNTKNKAPVISPWSIPPVNSYQTNFSLDNSARNSPNPLPNINPGGGANLTNLFNSVNVARNVPLPTVITPNAYTTVSTKAVEIPAAPTIANTAAATIIPAFQNYTSSSAITNNYSVNLLGGSSSNSSDSIKPFALQNPYTAAIRASNMNSNSQDSNASATTNTLASNQPQQSSVMFPGFFQDNKSDGSLQQQQTNAALPPAQMQQEPIAFASTNPYAQMYPNLFAQAATMGVTPKINMQSQMVSEQEPPKRVEGMDNSTESCTIKINNMCGSTTYSDLRKFFNGLFVPHNGIKMVNDKHGLRIGVAYIQFSRVSSVQKALVRNNTMLKTKRVTVEMVSDDEFERVEDSFRPSQRFERNDRNNRNNDSDGWRGGDSNNGDDSSNISEVRVNPFNLDRKPSQNHRHQQQQQQQEPFSVLYIEEIPALTTEQDIMKMFSSFSIYDILLIASPENRREFIAHVKFSRDEEAKAAFEDKSRHMIGYRKVRVRVGRAGEMEKAKEKLRLANEQLRKEEQALAAEEAKEAAEIEEKERKKAVGASTIVIDHDDDEDALMINMQGNIGDDFKRDLRQPNIPSIFDLSNSNKRSEGPSDPRLRRQQGGPPQNRFEGQQDQSNQSSNNNSNDFISHMMEPNFNNNPNDNANFNDIPHQLNAIENSFIIMKNCDYNTRINEVAELFMSSNLRLKHIEPLRNERRMPTGEFIVEFRDPRDAEMATNEFNNTQFRLRNLRVRPIAPQQIADILGKPFLNYYPGGGRNGPQPPHMHGGGGGGGPFEFFGRGGGNMGGGPPGNMMNFRGGPNMRFGGNMSMRGGGGRGGGMPPYGMSMRGMHGGRGGGMMGMGRGGGMMGFNFSPNNQSWNRDNQNYVSDNEESNDNMEDNTEMDAASDSGDVDKPNDDSNGGDDNAGDDNGDDDNGDDDNGGDDNGGDDNGGDDNGGDDNGGDDNGGDDNGGDDNDVDNDNEMSNDNDVSNVNDSQDDTGEAENKSGGIPEKFNRPGCVVTMENLPFKADLQDILRFFGDFKLIPDDIIRRFNDDGSPTGDARVAFATPILARAAFDARKRKYIFNRAIYLSIL